MKNEDPCPNCKIFSLSQWSKGMTARRCTSCGFMEEIAPEYYCNVPEIIVLIKQI